MKYRNEVIKKVIDIYLRNQNSNSVTRGAHNVFCKEVKIDGYTFVRQITPRNSSVVSIKKKSFLFGERAVLDIDALSVDNFDLIEDFYIQHLKLDQTRRNSLKVKF